MDISKLLSLLETRQLVFARADAFEDLYEGHWPEPSIAELEKYGDNSIAKAVAVQPLRERERMFISCWHENPAESAAMWRIFLKSNDGVAIKTSAGLLKKQLNKTNLHIEFGRVRYIDYSKEPIPDGRVFNPYFHKRLDFVHEREVRAVVWNQPSSTHRIEVQPDAKIFSINVDVPELIQELVIAPRHDSWFRELVETVVKKRYGIQCEISDSKVLTAPKLRAPDQWPHTSSTSS